MNPTLAAQIADADTDLLLEMASVVDNFPALTRGEAIRAIEETLAVPVSSPHLHVANLRTKMRNYGFSL